MDFVRFVEELGERLVTSEITVEEFVRQLQDYYERGERWVATELRSSQQVATDSIAT